METTSYEHTLDKSLTTAALDALEKKTGLKGQVVGAYDQVSPHYRVDAIINLTVDGRPHQYIAECKSNIDRKSLVLQVKAKLSNSPEQGLLIAPYISREIGEYCRQIELQFIDTHGNAYLNRPGIYVYTSGEKSETGQNTAHRVKGLTNAAALRITFAMLCEPAMVQVPYRDIVENTGVSLGAISRTFEDLKKRGLLIESDRHKSRRLLDLKRLFEEWVINYPVALRPKLNSRRFSAPNPAWWQNEHLNQYDAVWGGEVAAERITHYLKSTVQTLYVAPAARNNYLKHLISTYRLRPDPHGQVEILEKFWNFSHDSTPDLAPAILVYADLMATLDPRNYETAQIIREKFIETAFHQS